MRHMIGYISKSPRIFYGTKVIITDRMLVWVFHTMWIKAAFVRNILQNDKLTSYFQDGRRKARKSSYELSIMIIRFQPKI
jgi:hypothetical protein